MISKKILSPLYSSSDDDSMRSRYLLSVFLRCIAYRPLLSTSRLVPVDGS
jgi:hypothetical protein